MKNTILVLVALLTLVGMASAMTAPTTSNATKFLATPLNVGVPSTIDTPTTLGYEGLLTMPLSLGVPTGSFVTGISGNWEAFGPSSGSPPNWAEVIASGVTTQGFEGYS